MSCVTCLPYSCATINPVPDPDPFLSKGAFIGTIALVKIVVALTGGTTPLARTLGLLFAVTNVWVCARMWPMGALMADYHGEGKNNPALHIKLNVLFSPLLLLPSGPSFHHSRTHI